MEKKYPMAKALVGIIGATLAIPLIIGGFWFKEVNFYVSLALLALKITVADGYMAPTIAMMQMTVKPENQGSIVSAYLFFLTVAGCTATLLMGHLTWILKAAANPIIFGKLITIGSLIGFVGSIFSFWKAGKHYLKYKADNNI